MDSERIDKLIATSKERTKDLIKLKAALIHQKQSNLMKLQAVQYNLDDVVALTSLYISSESPGVIEYKGNKYIREYLMHVLEYLLPKFKEHPVGQKAYNKFLTHKRKETNENKSNRYKHPN